jgi:hypothetical protein
LNVVALCDTLTTDGAFRVDIASLLKIANRTCNANDVVNYRVVLAGSNQPIEPRSCQIDTLISPLTSGTWQAVVEALDAADKVQLTAWCEASVSPATTSTASCTLQ